MCFSINDYVAGILISLWTIVQTSCHIIWALYSYFSHVCKIQLHNYWFVMIHLTYLYNQECGGIMMEGDLLTPKESKKDGIFSDVESAAEGDNVHSIIHMIVKNATLPSESSEARRTIIYFILYIFIDGFWIATAILLLVGTYFRVKECRSLLFYGPWILITGATILLDTVSSVHFGLDLLKIRSYTTWLKFIGVSNYKDFSKFNYYDSSKYVPQGTSILMCLLFSRCFFFWLINVSSLFRITNIAILAFRVNASDTTSNNQEGNRRRRSSRNPGVYLNSTEARIRNWQLFYGGGETLSTLSNSSSDGAFNNNSINTRSGRNSARTDSITPVAQSSQNQEGHMEMGQISPIQEFSEILNNVSSHYTKFSDVADDILAANTRKESIGSLHGQLPWTYIRSSGVQGHSEMSDGSGTQKMRNMNDCFTGNNASNKTIISTAL